jgi:hypothetical protein
VEDGMPDLFTNRLRRKATPTGRKLGVEGQHDAANSGDEFGECDKKNIARPENFVKAGKSL